MKKCNDCLRNLTLIRRCWPQYLLPLSSTLRKHGISSHRYADDSQIYVPLKKKDNWMALNFLNFHEKKTEVMMFGPNGSCSPHST